MSERPFGNAERHRRRIAVGTPTNAAALRPCAASYSAPPIQAPSPRLPDLQRGLPDVDVARTDRAPRSAVDAIATNGTIDTAGDRGDRIQILDQDPDLRHRSRFPIGRPERTDNDNRATVEHRRTLVQDDPSGLPLRLLSLSLGNHGPHPSDFAPPVKT